MLCNVDSSGKPPDNLGFCTWTGTVRFFDAGDLDFELERSVRLLRNTKYAVVAQRTAGAKPPLSATASGSADSASSAGWDIGAGGQAWEWKMTRRQNGTFHERWERVPWARYLRFGLYGRFNLLNEPNGGNPPVFRDDDGLVELTIRENQPEGANVGSRLSNIVDRRGQTVTYSIVPDIAGNDIGGPDGDLFDIDPNNGQITAKQPFDFESAKEYYQFGVSASNAIGASAGVNVRVRVTDVDEPLEPLALCDGISPGGRGILCGTDPDPGEFWVRARSDTEVKVNWARPNPARGVPGPRSYLVVHRTGTSGPFDSHRVEASSAPGYAHTIEGLQPDTTYQVRVIVNNGEGNASSEIVTVRTHAHPQYAFRLDDTSGTNPQVGRPEFFFRGKWGTVTDHRADNAGNESGALMCKLAGFDDGEFIAHPRSQLGSSYRAAAASMPIWLDDVRCSAGATDINQCSHAGWGEANGDHSEDLWVRCWNGTPTTEGPKPERAYIEHGAARWVYIQFDTTLASEDGKTPGKDRFQVDVAAPGSTAFVPMAIDSVIFYPNSGRVRLVLPREIAWNESVRVGYADPNPDTDDATGVLEDRFGSDAPTFLSYDVDNEVRDEFPPNLTAGETSEDGRSVTVWFTEPLDRDTLPDPRRFTVRVTTRQVVADEQGMGTSVDTHHDNAPMTVAFATAADLSADARSRIAGKSACSAAPHTCALVLTMSDRDRIRGQDLRTYNFENGSRRIPIRTGHRAVKVRYADPSSANDPSGVAQDPFGNDAPTSHFATVKNRTTYGRDLLPLSAFVSASDASTTNLVFEWPLSDEDFPSSSELLSAFSITAGGSPATDLEVSATVLGPPGLSVADARVEEAAGAVMDFAVTMSRASTSTVTVDYATSDGTATAGADYTASSGTLSFAPGETSKTVSVPVLDDAHDDGGETFALTLSNVSGGNAWLEDASATGTIENADAMPRAWIARFGRTVADQVIEAVQSRMRAPRTPGAEVSLGGRRIGLGPLFGAEGGAEGGAGGGAGERGGDAAARKAGESEGEAEAAREARGLAEWLRGGGDAERRAGGGSIAMTERELLLGSSFSLTAAAGAGPGGTVSLWGRGAVSRFDGREGRMTLDGEVASGNRIALMGDRIAKVARSPDGFAVEHDARSGDIYLRPSGPRAGTHPTEAGEPEAVTLFIGTEKGFTYRLTMMPAKRDSAQILIRNAAVAGAGAAAGPAPGDARVAALVKLVRAVARREPLSGYEIRAGQGLSVSGFGVIETWRGPRFRALVLEADALPAASARLEGAAGLAGTIGELPGAGRVVALWLAAPGTGPSGGTLVVAVTEVTGEPR